VADSWADLRTIPVINGTVYLTSRIFLPLVNVGWGPMEDCVFRFHLERPDDPAPLTADISWPLAGDGQPADLEPFITALAEAGTDVSRVERGPYGPRVVFDTGPGASNRGCPGSVTAHAVNPVVSAADCLNRQGNSRSG
jgi:hypothetical protein